MGKITYFFHCIILLAAQYCLLLGARRVTNINTDKEALLALKLHITHDPSNLLQTNWSSNSVCNWVGITCGFRHHRVVALDLSHMGLTGTIPPHLGNLTFLSSISFANNSFYGSLPNELAHLRRIKFFIFIINNLGGEIPSWIGSFTQLQQLSLAVNNFVGAIPMSLCNLSKLNAIDLSSNGLQGHIPLEIGNLRNLRLLYLFQNKLSSSIPSTIFNISSLQEIVIRDNMLSGSIPTTLVPNYMSSLRGLDFTTNNLTGPLPLNICSHFPNLEELSLSFNLFYGVIPSTLFRCSQLKVLSLSYNHFQGSIHWDIGNLSMLQYLYLGLNNFSGMIPTTIGSLFNLEELNLIRSGLTGVIPWTIGNLTLLNMLDLSENHLTGTISSGVGNLRNLEFLDLGVNSLVGIVPSTIYNISTLMTMTLYGNQLSGQLPVSIGVHLSSLKEFLIGANDFSGPIPICLSNASELFNLDLGSNSFSGPIPNALGNLKNLKWLNLEENNLTTKSLSSELSIFSSLTNCRYLRLLSVGSNPLNGTLPISLANFSSSLEEFHAYDCGITGNIPKEIGNLSSLSILNLPINDLRGTIPTTIAKLQKLQGLDLASNKLKGSIPSELCDLQSLAYLYLRENELSGPIPSCLSNVTSLRRLSIEMNKFTSAIPSSLWRLKDILEVNLSSNSLIGSLPSDISNLKAVTLIDLSRNQLSGNIPPTFGSLKTLTNLSLSNNKLEGSIPESLGDTISLECLDLSNNTLTGKIPKSLEKLFYLSSFNVSYNELQGEIPNGGPFTNFSFQSFLGNKELCGAPRLQLQPCKNSIHPQSKTSKTLRYTLLAIGLAIFLTILAFVIVFIKNRKRNMRRQNHGQLLPLATWTRISIEQIKQATNKFNEINLLGKGSFGSVYKGTLQDGMSIAVKVFNLQVEGAFKSFDIECEVLRTIRHRNLAKIITACSNIDFKALVLEFMPNWSLEKWLYSHNYFLDMLQRLNIMVDVALALEYLHYGSTTPIVHCDLKPSNILLDEDMVGHVSDFGIAKLLGEEHSIIQTMTLATVGYMAPEYGSEGLVSIRGDMYSYGILLMETLTRKKPTDEMFTEEMNMKQWVEESFSLACGVTHIADANLLKSNDRHFSAKKNCIASIMALALECSADLPEERIDVKDAVSSLKKIKVKFLKDIGQS